jgi:hypothetical protein
MRRTLSLLLVSSAALLAMWGVATSRRAAESGTPGAGTLSPLEMLGLRRTAPVASWTVGRRLSYRLHFESSVTAGGQPLVRFTLDGPWHLDVLRAEGSGVLVAGTFAGSFESSGANQADGKALADHESSFQLPFFWTVAEGGEVREFRSQPGTPAFVENAWKGALAPMQYVGARGSTGEWRTRERDTHGLYEARYRLLDDRAVTKARSNYEPAAANLGGVKSSLDESEIRFAFDDRGTMTHFRASE